MKDLTGIKFGRLEVMNFSHKRKTPNGTIKYYWNCSCDCGNSTIVESRDLRSGHTRSCGCLHYDSLDRLKHGQCRTRLYRIWRRMKERCKNPNCSDYGNYGGRGITLAEEWLTFEPFFLWAMNNGYSDDLSIDRIENDGPYAPENCRWITQKKQCNNKRTCRYIEHNGKIKTLKEWAEIYGIHDNTLRSRLGRGLSIEQALTKKVKRKINQEETP